MKRGAALAFLVLCVGCQGTGETDPDPSRNPSANSGGLISRPGRLRANTVFLVVSREYEPLLSHFADSVETREFGVERVHSGRGRCRIILDRLTIECKEYKLKIIDLEPGEDPHYEIMADGEVEFTSRGQTNRAGFLRIENDSPVFGGEFESDVEYRIGREENEP